MITTPLAILDQAELLQLALNASSNNDSGTAIIYLKEAVSRSDATGKAHFILGAEYAQIRMYDRALTELEAAIALDPTLSIARFQLGLLWLTSDAPDKALDILRPLDELTSANALSHFARGLICLINNEFTDALQSLQEGIQRNTENPALNQDMQKIVDELHKLPSENYREGEAGASENTSAHHIFLSAYTGKENMQ
ncbi:MAG TPA: tetratricopeptide repeat protein [Noviherbaspirillum sp.]|nr:tetratricopeptide repeat protein [Noviherbaspirillum sp.]